MKFSLAVAAAAVIAVLLLIEGADAQAQRKILSARHQDNQGLSLNTTHRRVRMRPGALSHFDHHSVKRGNLASHAHMFNVFRLMGDFSHVASFAFLVFRLQSAGSCAGISLKTQEIYLALFLFRYVDVFTNFISMYNTCMKCLFIFTTAYIVYMMRVSLKDSLSPEPEGSKLAMVIVPGCVFLAVVLNDHNVSDSYFACFQSFLWALSIYLEAVAIVPQMALLKRKKVVENLTANYIVALGAYRFMYLVNWAYRWFVDPISGIEFFIKVAAGLVQSGLYVNFFWTYYKSKKDGPMGGDVIMDAKGYI